MNCNDFKTLVLWTVSGVDVFISLDLLFLCFLFLWKKFTFNCSGVFSFSIFSVSQLVSPCRVWCYFFMDYFFTSFPILSLHVSSPPPPPKPLSLHSMRVKAPKLCLPPLLRPSTQHCPSPPAPRWMTPRWRRSWRSASSCRWRCRGYGKKTNRSGWDVPKHRDILQDGLYFLMF